MTIRAGIHRTPGQSKAEGSTQEASNGIFASGARSVGSSSDMPLGAGTRAHTEARLGYTFSRIGVHTNTRAAEPARVMRADAFAPAHARSSSARNCPGMAPRVRRDLEMRAKSASNEPGDEFEREADRVADQVMRMPSPPRGARLYVRWDVCERANGLGPYTSSGQAGSARARRSGQCARQGQGSPGIAG